MKNHSNAKVFRKVMSVILCFSLVLSLLMTNIWVATASEVENLALGKRVELVGGTGDPVKLTDGNKAVTSNGNAWLFKGDDSLIIDLGEPMTFNRVSVFEYQFKRAKGYEIRISTDKETWETVAESDEYLSTSDREGFMTGSNNHIPHFQGDVDFDVVEARYIEVIIKESANPGQEMKLEEIEVYYINREDSGGGESDDGKLDDGTPYDVNLARSKSIEASTDAGQSAKLTDGNKAITSNTNAWQFNANDSLILDLGELMTFNRVSVFEYQFWKAKNYVLEASIDEENWEVVAESSDYLSTHDRDGFRTGSNLHLSHFQGNLTFDPVTARYIKLTVKEQGIDKSYEGSNSATMKFEEIEVYRLTEERIREEEEDASRIMIRSLILADSEGKEKGALETIHIEKTEKTQINVKGMMSNGTPLDPTTAGIQYKSSHPEVATIGSDGLVTGISNGVTQITAGADGKSATVYINVFDPETAVIDLGLMKDETTSFTIGDPAFIDVGEAYPRISAYPYFDGILKTVIVSEEGKIIAEKTITLVAKEETFMMMESSIEQVGLYTINLTLSREGKEDYHETLYFYGVDESTIKLGQSQAAFLGDDGKFTYVPDYRGNQILDYSNSGYMGGGISLPDIQARIVLEPDENSEDDTARIQAAIDRVSAMPMNENGFRGAVLLKKGVYKIEGTLNIMASGIVLRGEGSGSEGDWDGKDSTVIYATGTTQRNVIQVGTEMYPEQVGQTAVKILDHYVPVGAKTFTVEDARDYRVGDDIYVIRRGNDRWINEIDMDSIYPREGANATIQWGPFNMQFDRVITKIEGNQITIDAPLGQAIETRWGGGEIVKYRDTRIENVGIEGLRVDVQVNPATFTDDTDSSVSDSGAKYGIEFYSDENHASTFVHFRGVKNGWARDLIGRRLIYALVNVGKQAKWITVQDSDTFDFASQITGSRRYAYNVDGQLVLVQRCTADGARHSFTTQSNVAGPNVYLDCIGTHEYNRSEPHQRWSVGGLYDNVESDIAIQDRGWYGTGHGWSGANYTTWNTKGDLQIQKAPTATSYGIGHVGRIIPGNWPSTVDPRSRESGYIDSEGSHVEPVSLYLQQLEDRLGDQAVYNIRKTPIGGGSLDIPEVTDHLQVVGKIDQNTFASGGLLEASVEVTNFTQEAQEILTILAIYNKDNKMIDFVETGATIAVKETKLISNELALPEELLGYTAKLYIWDGLSLELSKMNPLSEPVAIQFIPKAQIVGVEASHYQDAPGNVNPPENSYDGDFATRWSADGEAWIQYDLGKVYLLEYMKVAFFKGNERSAILKIEVSEDGENWAEVFDGIANGKTDQLQDFDFDRPISGRYVKIRAYTNTNGNQWNSITEVEIYPVAE